LTSLENSEALSAEKCDDQVKNENNVYIRAFQHVF